MQTTLEIDMAEVTRLTCEGRLEEAMALLAGGAPHAAAAPQSPPAFRVRRAARAPKVTVPEGALFETRSFAGAAGRLGYKLYIPASRRRGAALIVMLHGCTQSPEDFAAGTRMNELAEAEGFLVAYPAQSTGANAQGCWNWFEAGHQRRDAGEPALIAGMTRALVAEFSIDPARVFVAGLSAGGAMAAILAGEYSDLYAAAGVHSGLAAGAAKDMPSAFAAMSGAAKAPARAASRAGAPLIVFHGDRDKTVHPRNGEQVIARAGAPGGVTRGQSAGGAAWTRTNYSGGEHWLLHGAGHAWSGGGAAGSYTDPRGPDASGEMLRFFKERSDWN